MPGRRDLLTLRLGQTMGHVRPDHDRDHWIRVYRGAMACRFEVTLSGEDARHISVARDALTEADRLEAALTVFRDSSDLVRVNQTAADAPAPVDAELFDLLARCRALHDETDGAFDVTSTPLSRCWGFLDRQGRVPVADHLDAARARVGMPLVTLDADARTVRFARAGMELNLGSIGKGYAVERIADRLRARGVRHALVSAGSSSVRAIGGRGDGWSIHLRSRGAPRFAAAAEDDAAASEPLARVWLRDAALGTSGAGEQFIEADDGRRYGHVLDPRTGWPASGLLSVSVIARDAADADAWATACFVGGLDLARRYCDAHPNRALVIVTTEADPRHPHVIGRYDGAIVEARS
jgi:thiamine biosynthesis lipoprotein